MELKTYSTKLDRKKDAEMSKTGENRDLSTIILLLDNDGLFASVLACQDNAHLTGFHEFDHGE